MSDDGFANQLRRHRQAAGMTQESLAEASSLSVRGISDLERGVKQRPHPETVRLLATALNLAPDALAAFRGAATPRASLNPVPISDPLTPLVDRVDERREIAAQLQPDTNIRLLTLTGPGGVGKTRLSIQVARDVRDHYADGIAFVALAGLTDPRLVLPAMATALGIRDLSDRAALDFLTRQLQDRQVLVVVDNVEHILAAAPDLAALLAGCAGLTILATSRAPLRITGEREYPVRPLALPEPGRTLDAGEIGDVPSVQLFVQQAQAVQPQFAVTDASAAAVAAICARVDGLPLALELAAVRMKSLAPGELASLLDNRLGVLTGGPRNHPVRHQTVRDTIGWSHDLLPTDDQVTFRRFAVFPVGATLASAAAVLAAGDHLLALDQLTALLDQSLVQRFDGRDGQPRFVMLETIREYATERLAASDEESLVRDRHAAHFLEMAEQGEEELTGPDQAAWMQRLEADYGNLRSALAWTVEGEDSVSSQRFGSALWGFWAASGRLREGREWLDRALALDPDETSAVRAHALLRRGNIAIDLADYATARARYEDTQAISRALGDETYAALSLAGVAMVQMHQGDFAHAARAFEEVLRVSRARAWRAGEANALLNLGINAIATGDYPAARSALHDTYAIQRAERDATGIAWACLWLGCLSRLEKDPENAHRLLTDAIEHFRATDDRLGVAWALNDLGRLAHDVSDEQVALECHLDALRERDDAGDVQGVVECLEGIAAAVIALGQVEKGVALMSAAGAWRRTHGAPLYPSFQGALQRAMEQARAALAPAAFDQAWREGEIATLDDAIDLALATDP